MITLALPWGWKPVAVKQETAIQPRLAQIFERYGLPDSILTDNGAPWWGTKSGTVTQISIWLIRLGIRLTRCRPYHPQTQGKDERFHRTLKAELIAYRPWKSLAQCQREFDRWRTVYNFERPHEALKLEVPASRYRPSPRPFPGRLPAIEYGPDDHVCNVGWNGSFEYEGRSLQVSSALKGFPVAVRLQLQMDLSRSTSAISVLERSILMTLEPLNPLQKVLPMYPNTCYPCTRSIHRPRKGDKRRLLPAAPNAAQAGPSNAGEARAVATQPHWKGLASRKE